MTYEDSEEGKFLATLGSRRGGVRNTAFAIFAPDGTPLSDTGRAPRQVYVNDDALLDHMRRLAKRYPGKPGIARHQAVPYASDVRRGLVVAACDKQPLLVVSIADEKQRAKVEQTLASLVWSADYRGRFAYARSESKEDLTKISGSTSAEPHVFLVQPGPYGVTGSVLTTAPSLDKKSLRKMLDAGLKSFVVRTDDRERNRRGRREGVEWKAEDLSVREETDGSNERRRSRRRR